MSPCFSVYVSTYAINYSEHRDLAMKPNYILSKFTGTYGYSLLADGVKPEVMQVVSFHPGVSFTENWSQFGITKEMLPFDEKARFLHGRYVYATWDVNKLASEEVREKLNADHNNLRPGIIGLTEGGHRAK
ncbi:MAG: hypothetical protein STHCBS139747_003027 [Sporothrix thermara]